MAKSTPKLQTDADAARLAVEREQIRSRIGSIGGKSRRKIDVMINITFLVIVVALFVLEVGFGLLPPLISIEIAVLLVSVKVIIVMTSLQRVSHYEFWILNTIDFRISQLEASTRSIQKSLEEPTNQDSAADLNTDS